MNVRPIVRAMCRPMVRGVVPSAFSPLSLFANGEEGAWYDPSDLTTLFQDSAGTIPVTTDGDPVGLMLDKSGNDNHATQASSGLKPIYRTDGTLHWLEFDGFDDAIATAGTLTIANPWTFFVGGKVYEDAGGTNRCNLVEVSTGATGGIGFGIRPSADFLYAYSRLSSQSVPGTNVNDTNSEGFAVSVSSALFDVSTIQLRRNGSETLSTSQNLATESDTGAALRLGIGALTAASLAPVDLYGVVAVASAPDSAQIAGSEGYVATKSGVTL